MSCIQGKFELLLRTSLHIDCLALSCSIALRFRSYFPVKDTVTVHDMYSC